jgi:hypothetical protein
MRRTVPLLTALGLIFLANISTAYACGTGEIQFEDNFDELDPSWGDGGESLKVVDGQLQIITTSPQTFRAISHFSVYGDADVCVTTVHVKGPEDQSSTGIVYWFADPQNFYWFAISTAGTYAVFRYMKDKWQNIIPWTTSDAVNKGPQAKNALRVHTEGNVSTLFVNDKQIAKIKGVPWSNFHRNQLRRLLTISPSRRISLVQPMRFKPAA